MEMRYGQIIQGQVVGDLRRRPIEGNGKHILVGVYPGAIRLRKPPPVPVSRLFVWLQLELTRVDYSEYELRIVDPREELVTRFRGQAKFKRTDEPATLICSTGPLTIPDYGIYRVEFGMKTPPRLLGTFAVRPVEEAAPPESGLFSSPNAPALARRH
jgi:hypothetical protein